MSILSNSALLDVSTDVERLTIPQLGTFPVSTVDLVE